MSVHLPLMIVTVLFCQLVGNNKNDLIYVKVDKDVYRKHTKWNKKTKFKFKLK